jgi:hypothetical protein
MIPAEFLDLMRVHPEAQRHDDGIAFDKSLAPGIGLFGPYRRFPAGWHRLSFTVSWQDLDEREDAGLTLDVVINEGRQTLAARDVPADRLRELGQDCTVEVRFFMPRNLSGAPVEVRLMRKAAFSLRVKRAALVESYLVAD